MTAFLCALGGYLAGSIPFAILVSRILGLPGQPAAVLAEGMLLAVLAVARSFR